jgi:hypothetical protein
MLLEDFYPGYWKISIRVIGRIRSSSLGDIHRVIGRFLSGLTHCERLGQTYRIIGMILIMWYQITGFITASIFS